MIKKRFKEKKYEVVSPEAQFIWGCDSKEEAVKQLHYVKTMLGHKDAYINEYEQEYEY